MGSLIRKSTFKPKSSKSKSLQLCKTTLFHLTLNYKFFWYCKFFYELLKFNHIKKLIRLISNHIGVVNKEYAKCLWSFPFLLRFSIKILSTKGNLTQTQLFTNRSHIANCFTTYVVNKLQNVCKENFQVNARSCRSFTLSFDTSALTFKCLRNTIY